MLWGIGWVEYTCCFTSCGLACRTRSRSIPVLHLMVRLFKLGVESEELIVVVEVSHGQAVELKFLLLRAERSTTIPVYVQIYYR